MSQIKSVLVTMTAYIDVDVGDEKEDPMARVKKHMVKWIDEEDTESFVDAVVDGFREVRR